MKALSLAPVIFTSQPQIILSYYINVLGFNEEFRYQNYFGLSLDEASVHITELGGPHCKLPGSTALYIFVEGVDEYYSAVTAQGAPVISDLQEHPYGMRDFAVTDPDGNVLTFGQIIGAD
jgi:uncharacterized glyoxalase superfamily protein PhnB